MAPSLCLLLALLALSGTTLGQSSKIVGRYTKPLETVRLDLATGELTLGPHVRPQAAGTVEEFSNLDLSGFAAVDTGSCYCQWIDAGVKGHQGNASDLMSSFTLAYCSGAVDSSVGGPGGSCAIGFYEGYTTGGGTPSTQVAMFTFTGLPAATGVCSFIGSPFRCYLMDVDMGSLVCFADGPVGYSWKFLDRGTCGTAPSAASFPLLSCVQSCSGLQDQGGAGGPNPMDNYIDQYCPPGFLRSTFNFGTTPLGQGSPFYLSLGISVREVADCPATLVSANGQDINRNLQAAPAAVVGEPWMADVTLLEPANPASGFLVLLFSPDALVTGPRISILGGPVTELLLGPTSLSTPCPMGTYAAGSGTVCGGVVIPKDPALVSSPWCTQVLAGTPGAGFTLTNSLCGTVGTE